MRARHSWLVLVLVLVLVLLVLPAGAAAADPPLLWQSPVDGLAGSGAGQLSFPQGVAADPVSGHVYVADGRNARVSEFDAWGQFVKAWGWGVSDGSEELQTCGPGALAPIATCLPGIVGAGAGQFGAPGPYGGSLGGITVDAAGDIYVADLENFRVQKFDPGGNFILAFGDGVDQTTGADICTAASKDACGPGASGEGPGQITLIEGTHLALGLSGDLFVGGPNGSIQVFEADGTFKEKIVLEDELEGRSVESLAIDSLGHFFVASRLLHTNTTQMVLEEFDSSGTHLKTLETDFEIEYFSDYFEEMEKATVQLQPASPLAVDPSGNLYTVARYQQVEKQAGYINELIRFDPAGKHQLLPGASFNDNSAFAQTLVTGLALNKTTAAGGTDVYGSVVRLRDEGKAGDSDRSAVAAWGPPPDKWAPPIHEPEIGDQYAILADTDAATVRASINPQFWADTSYKVEFGTGRCAEGGCPSQTTEAQLGAGVTNVFKNTPQVTLPGLAPATTYHFRFLAQSSGGGPVYGIAPDGGQANVAEGLEGTFTTPSPPAPLPSSDTCPNSTFRGGPSAFLPDCRAYEMVSPVDKAGGEIRTLYNAQNEPLHFNQATPEGGKLTYSSSRAFGDAGSAPANSQYVASRGPNGWATHGISPTRNVTYKKPGATLESQFHAFTADLCQGWIVHDTDPPLTADAPTGFANIYRVDLCGAEESYEALTRSAPLGIDPINHLPQVQGTSADGTVSVFRVNGQLAVDAGPKAAPGGDTYQCYQFADGKLRLVSVLPSGLANPGSCSIGVGGGPGNPHLSNLDGAVSDDGSKIFWTDLVGISGGGRIYLRTDAKNPTVAVSEGGEIITGGKPGESTFLTAAADGSRAIYSVGGLTAGTADLYEFATEGQTTTPIAGKVRGILGASQDATRIYLVSREALASGATAGQNNLYLYDSGAGGSFRYIGALAPLDDQPQSGRSLSPISVQPAFRSSRVSADGSVAIFASTAPLTGFDNADASSGEAAREVFRYDADADGGAGRLDCVSCNATGVRPSGKLVSLPGSESYSVAAQIPGHEMATYASRVLSADGSRLFFESFEPLSQRDTNNQQDVYEWQLPGSGSCSLDSPDYSPSNGGCLSLISSGQSPEDSSFVDASASGDDVFIATASSLLPQDPGLVDIYDARVGGGFPQPEPPAPCQGEGCQGAVAPPPDPTPASAAFEGAGNPVQAAGKQIHCPKSKRKLRRGGKVRCVSKKARQRDKRAER